MKTRLVIILLMSVALFGQSSEGLIGHWVLDGSLKGKNTVLDQTGHYNFTATSQLPVQKNKVTAYLERKGDDDPIFIPSDQLSQPLPARDISVSAWVRIDRPNSWGGILGAMEDNGGFEKGWILGFTGEQFYFGLSTKGADDGDGRMDYITSQDSYSLTSWNHVAATYDGKTVRLYVNGKLQKESTRQSGDILYPEQFMMVLGSYVDSNEDYPTRGGLREIWLYNKVISAGTIRQQYARHKALGDIPVKGAEPRFVVKPYLQAATKTSMTVMWETNFPARAVLKYGAEVPLEKELKMDDFQTLFEVVIPNLKPQSNYFYQVEVSGKKGENIASDVFSFQTAVEDNSAFAFGVVSDTQNNPGVWGNISTRIFSERPNFVVHTGDIVGTGSNKYEWTEEFFAPGHDLMSRIPVYLILGNHEGDADNYYRYISNPDPEYYYTITYGNAQYFFIDTDRKVDAGSEQHEWLDKALAESKATWKFALHHHPPYTSDENDYGDTWKGKSKRGDQRLRPLIDLYEKYNVDMVFFGHIHDYERTWPLRDDKVDLKNGVVYIQAGGGGGSLENYAPTRSWFTAKVYRDHHYLIVNVFDKTLSLQAIDQTGRLFDQITLQK
jgi:predicted phosphodiesterase